MNKILLYPLIFLFYFFFLKDGLTGPLWIQASSGTTNNLYKITLNNNSTGWIVGGNGTVLKTTNLNDWYDISDLFSSSNLRGQDIYFVNSLTGYISFTGIGAKVYKTSNGGNNWTLLWYPSWGITRISFINSNTGFAIGNDFNNGGHVYKTINGGLNWQDAYTSTGELYTLQVLNQSNVFIGGSSGLWRSTNIGNSWEPLLSNININDVNFYDSNLGIAVGSSGRIRRTTNAGYTWSSFNNYTTENIYAVKNLNSSDTYFAGNSGKFFKLYFLINNSNAANTDLTISGAGPLNSLFFLNENTGWVVGNSGRIYKSTNANVNIRSLSTTIPSKYKLFTNYPNPFNPTTKIKFDLPQNSFVKINIFDITGRIISELANTNLQPGSYETEFNGANLSSGVYYYRIEANSFSDTKKMILVK